MNNHYQTLGIPFGSSQEEIKQAFRRLAHQYHPDKPGGNEAKFKEINHAYTELMKRPDSSASPKWSDAYQQTQKNPFVDFMMRRQREAMKKQSSANMQVLIIILRNKITYKRKEILENENDLHKLEKELSELLNSQ